MMRRRFSATCAVLGALMLAGCAPTTMPLSRPDEKLNDNSAVYLLMITMENQIRPSFHPKVAVIHVQQWVNGKWKGIMLNADTEGMVVVPGASGYTYAARMTLPPGEYRLRSVSAQAAAFPLVSYFNMPVYTPLTAREPRGVFYLGHVRATVRMAKAGELRAGPPFPVIQQTASGAADGTFDVNIRDEWHTDEALFRGRFPALGNTPVRKALLPAWDRERAKREEEANQ